MEGAVKDWSRARKGLFNTVRCKLYGIKNYAMKMNLLARRSTSSKAICDMSET